MKISKLNSRSSLQEQLSFARKASILICQSLKIEDYGVQAMPDVSPPKWHLAHTTWFFEVFVLSRFLKNYRPFDPMFAHLFNSYYETVGSAHPKKNRGILSRPDVESILLYRQQIEDQVIDLLQSDHPALAEIESIIKLGIEHEQQHQELLLMDIKFNFSQNPLLPVYLDENHAPNELPANLDWLHCPAGLYEIGANPDSFHFDNESPRHQVYLQGFGLAKRLSSNLEYLAFIEDGGYQRVDLWLSEGWQFIQEQKIGHPLYWQYATQEWKEFTLSGLKKLDPHRPVSHISYFEADAFARWKGVRLPTEFEWEIAAQTHLTSGNCKPRRDLETGANQNLADWFYQLWQWTASSYQAYPGFRPSAGSLGEYNGKFMCNQYVLRGGSYGTPRDHFRLSYRNFFPAGSRWMFSGIRLAKELEL